MSSCDCDRKSINGGTFDSAREEEVSLGKVVNTSSPMSFAPVVAVDKVVVSIEVRVETVSKPVNVYTNELKCLFRPGSARVRAVRSKRVTKIRSEIYV